MGSDETNFFYALKSNEKILLVIKVIYLLKDDCIYFLNQKNFYQNCDVCVTKNNLNTN
jgi:hypothetical protein